MPEVVLGVYYGNVDGLIFAAIGCSLLLLGRWPVAAGASMSLVWLKPHVGIPIVMLLALFQPLYRRRMLVGFGVATCLLLALTVMVTGFHSLTLWVRGMENFSHGTGTYGDVASLAVPWAPAPALMVRLSLQVIGFSVASGLTIAWWWKCRRYDDVPVLAYAWLWPVWLLAAPFSHFHDEILLAIPVVALVGRDGSRAMRWPSVLALYLLVMSVVLLSVHPFHTQFVWVPLLGLSACLVAGAYAARAHYVSLPSGCLRSAH